MKTIELPVATREAVGKKAAKASRRQGNIPANVYGEGVKATSIAIGEKQFYQLIHHKVLSTVLFSLKIEGQKTKKDTTCLIKEVQRDPVTDQILHVDFAAISLTEKIKVKVPLVVRGGAEAAGTKEGGVLDVVHHEIEVECLPTQIPEKIETNAKHLKIGGAIHLKEIQMPEGVTAVLSGEEVIVALRPPAKEPEPVEAAEGATEPEVIEKGRKDKPEEGAEAPAEKPEKAEKSEKKSA